MDQMLVEVSIALRQGQIAPEAVRSMKVYTLQGVYMDERRRVLAKRVLL
ncbi:MAG: hypothetical protein WKF84_18460 [Pyrinomonadaceae bacterium]